VQIDWATLAAIAVVAAAAALTVVLLVALALAALSARPRSRIHGPDHRGAPGTHPTTGTALAALCLLAAGLIVSYGLYLIIA
jgi:membrane-associated phospholipid phosphatase